MPESLKRGVGHIPSVPPVPMSMLVVKIPFHFDVMAHLFGDIGNALYPLRPDLSLRYAYIPLLLQFRRQVQLVFFIQLVFIDCASRFLILVLCSGLFVYPPLMKKFPTRHIRLFFLTSLFDNTALFICPLSLHILFSYILVLCPLLLSLSCLF